MGLRYGKNPGRQARYGAGGAAMNATPPERLSDQLTRPRLLKRQERLEALLQEAAATDLSYADFLDQVLGEEVIAKAVKHGDADEFGPFPIVKSLEVFDFSYQPSLDKQLQQVAIYHFMEHGENVVLLGPPGVGKSHLAIGLGSTRSSGCYRLLFTAAAAMIAMLTRALTENLLEDKLKLYTIPRLLIVDGLAICRLTGPKPICFSN